MPKTTTKKQTARVALRALLYVSVPIEPGESEQQVIARAAQLVESAEAKTEFLEIETGFDESAGAAVYPVRTAKGAVSVKGASIEDVEDVPRKAGRR